MGSLRYVAPPSKSYSHRSLLISAVSRGVSRIRGLSMCDDVKATLRALRLLGIRVSERGGDALVEGGELQSPGVEVDCGGSASTLRMLAPIVAAKPSCATYTGDESLRRRPVKMLEDAFESLGVEAVSDGGRPPLTVRSKGFYSNRVFLDASESSQHVSGFLIAGARLGRGFTVFLRNSMLVSKPYVDLTLRMLRMHSVEASMGNGFLRVEPGEPASFSHTVPGDYSLSAIPMAASAFPGFRVEVQGLLDEPQPDREVVETLRGMGLSVEWLGNTLIAENTGVLKPCVLDCSGNPDLVPALTLAAAAAEGTTVLKGVGRLEVKESMRATLITRALSKLGVKTFFNGEEIIVEGPCRLRGSTVDAGGDHRIEMMLITAGMVAEGETTILNAGSVSKSNPGFYGWLEKEGVELKWV
ncbi:MAG: 3-phosphoshikimate 1-carboxyvinyltransferase [Thermofilum sp.]